MDEVAWFAGVATCIKILLIPSYRSTDFEVHRHWLALTHSLPLSNWYSDRTSPWTLDYPPLFAFFEYFLSLPASLIDPTIVNLTQGLNYSADSVVLFQRFSVILSDFMLVFAIYRLTKDLPSSLRGLVCIAILWSPSLFIVDHVHFQYNGFLLGILMLSLSFLREGRDFIGGLFFAVLLCFKHLFAVAAPVYFVYLLRHYCWGKYWIWRFLMLGLMLVSVLSVAFGPFIYYGQMKQVIQQLFPFDRGLCHAYWAPNFWTLYIIADKGIGFILRRLGLNVPAPTASFTGGLVGASPPFAILPKVTPLATFLLVLLSLSPCLVKAWKQPKPDHIIRWVSYAYTCGFLFGWHVHEKASMHFVIPLGFVAVSSLEDAAHYNLLSVVSCYSQFPLLFETKEYPVKVVLLLLHSFLMWSSFSLQFGKYASGKKANDAKSEQGCGERIRLIGKMGRIYLLGLLVIEVWGQFLHTYLLGDKLPFVPLMLVSVYCSFGMVYSWGFQLKMILRCT
ncbi:probable dolichyl pyrophosphate Glc1Man9GlcNAc2 alpha-1,3-glucosyltransferase [Amborella trichopoda]|uniref:Alpha-1,3-glucosyltransferase n=1 Tax=Amborella trichopoda TaxID=13333 RepID=W1NV46_AMBTC|nr:probable dolichyl pyrophosphate Glc1Man9GlcNAc2 alpha-1,3-glucosyltransferase [Amborella trichopoda]ERM99163.1 hypothetical protein AMTR_s00092p00046430 [Amborella trichopoda]|eukprot:XP_006836310.1 probable dolichyl pyrophosphate Glc1Man9GlcNAc2 alpha-1,3-glucosyltransferase [Amborella trichopoda]